jgi:hypothetical protein
LEVKPPRYDRDGGALWVYPDLEGIGRIYGFYRGMPEDFPRHFLGTAYSLANASVFLAEGRNEAAVAAMLDRGQSVLSDLERVVEVLISYLPD